MNEQATVDDVLYGETPTALIPKMGEFPVSNSAFYRQLIMTEAAGGSGEGETLSGSVDPFAPEPAGNQAPTSGVLLTFEQGWYQEGLALGELRKSLSLAPGEVTKLAVVDWRRQSRATDTSTRTDVDVAVAASNEGTNIESVQRGVSQHTERGTATSFGMANHAEAGGSIGGLFASASASGSHSSHMGMSATASTGSRSVASEAAKSVQRATEQVAQSTRSSRATQVVEVNESESQSTSTRVVANYNHAHALTMQYFEVLQIYRLGTKVVRADRCVFIPMEPLRFDSPSSLTAANDSTIELLREVLQAFGATELDKMVADFHDSAPALAQEQAALQTRANAIQVRIDNMPGLLEQAHKHVNERADAVAKANRDAPPETINAVFAQIPNPAFEIHRLTVIRPAEEALRHARGRVQAVENQRRQLQNDLQRVRDEEEAVVVAAAESDRMFGILAKHQTFLNQQMWMRIDDHQWHRKLAGKKFPHGDYEGQEIGGLINPTPVGYFGNYVAFTWEFPATNKKQSDDFTKQYATRINTSTRIALPTEGVFGEAVLGQANSAEKIDITRFWNWQDSPIPILPPSLGPVRTDSRAGNVVVPSAPLDFGPTIVKLRELGVPADIDDSALTAALQSSGAGSNAQAALIAAAVTAGVTASNNAADGAGRAGQRTIDAMKNAQDFTVGLANSEVGKIAATAIAGSATGGASTVGGLINAATKATKVIDLATSNDSSSTKKNSRT